MASSPNTTAGRGVATVHRPSTPGPEETDAEERGGRGGGATGPDRDLQARDFETFFARHHREVVRALTLALPDGARAEDVAQEAFARAYRRWRRVCAMERPVAWVYVVALNLARRQWGRDAARPDAAWSHGAGGSAELGIDPAGPVVDGIAVQSGLARLAPRQRAALVLRYLADLTVPEVADAMGCSLGTAKATIHQALRRLRVAFEEDEL